MTDYRSLYDKDFIGAWDLAEGDKTITITKCVGGQLTSPGGRKSKKPVVYFQGSEKGFALNATNGKTIAALYGNHVEKWAGKRITLYKSMTRSPQGDGDVECIRVRPAVPAAGKDGAFAGGGDEQLEYINAEQARELLSEMERIGMDKKRFLLRAKIESIDKLLASDFEGAKAWIAKMANEVATQA